MVDSPSFAIRLDEMEHKTGAHCVGNVCDRLDAERGCRHHQRVDGPGAGRVKEEGAREIERQNEGGGVRKVA